MATPPRLAPDNQDALDLLQRLITAPPAPPDARMHPIALRSTLEQRRHALSGYRLRTRVDALLQRSEQALLLAVLIFFGVWFADGPLRDWLHERYAAPAAPARPALVARAPRPPAPAPAGLRPRAPEAPLPYTTAAMEAPALEPEFAAPRQRPAPEPVEAAPEPTRLLIPAITLDTSVKEVFIVDGAWEVADYAAGYLHGTGLPGEVGNAALAGHAGLRGAVFRDLGALTAGDEIYVDAGGWRYRYRVRETKRVWPTQVEVLAPTDTAVLTLMTCTNWDTQRLVVVADLAGAQPSPES